MATRQPSRLFYVLIVAGLLAILVGSILTGRWGYFWLGLIVLAAAAVPFATRR